jgi:hypothetical protein
MSVLLSHSLRLGEKSKFKGSVYIVDLTVYTNCITVSDNVIDIKRSKLYSVGIYN